MILLILLILKPRAAVRLKIWNPRPRENVSALTEPQRSPQLLLRLPERAAVVACAESSLGVAGVASGFLPCLSHRAEGARCVCCGSVFVGCFSTHFTSGWTSPLERLQGINTEQMHPTPQDSISTDPCPFYRCGQSWAQLPWPRR